ncbi:MAG: HAD family phosphatase [Chloroflexota bacterium]
MPDATPPPAANPATPAIPGDPAAILFDLDGTVVDTLPARREAWLRTFREVGIPADGDHIDGLLGSDGKRLAREVAALAGRTLDDARAEAIDRRAGELFGQLNVDPKPLPGIVALLTAIGRSGILEWAIATSSRAEQVAASIGALGLGEAPRVIDGSSVKHAKPAPDLLLLAAEKLDLSPRRCWYVGDATWDMLAAKAAGMPAIGVTSGAVDAAALRRAGGQMIFPDAAALHDELRTRGLVAG